MGIYMTHEGRSGTVVGWEGNSTPGGGGSARHTGARSCKHMNLRRHLLQRRGGGCPLRCGRAGEHPQRLSSFLFGVCPVREANACAPTANISTQVSRYVWACVCVCVCARARVCVHLCAPLYIFVCTCVCVCARARVRACMCMCVCAYVCVHVPQGRWMGLGT